PPEDRPVALHGADRGPVGPRRFAPGPPVRRRPATDGVALLHQLGRAALHSSRAPAGGGLRALPAAVPDSTALISLWPAPHPVAGGGAAAGSRRDGMPYARRRRSPRPVRPPPTRRESPPPQAGSRIRAGGEPVGRPNPCRRPWTPSSCDCDRAASIVRSGLASKARDERSAG